MAANAPSNIIPSFKKVKDPLTNLQTACEFSARLSFDQAKLQIQASVDEGAFSDCTFEVLSNFPPMIRILGVTIPRDAYSHPVIFKLWHADAVNGDSPVITCDPVVAVFDMLAPDAPTAVSATVLRNRVGIVPDMVRVQWTSNSDVSIILLDDQGKKRTVGSASDTDNELIIENCSRFGTQDGTPHAFRFGVQSVNRSTASPVVYADPVNLTTTDSSVATQTPDDIAGTAQYLTNAQFTEWLSTQFPATDSATVASVLTTILTKVKDVVAKGGCVTLSDFGVFKAIWTPERTAYRNGQYITVAPIRNADFVLSLGFQKGTKLGQVMSDTEAASV